MRRSRHRARPRAIVMARSDLQGLTSLSHVRIPRYGMVERHLSVRIAGQPRQPWLAGRFKARSCRAVGPACGVWSGTHRCASPARIGSRGWPSYFMARSCRA